MSVLRRRRMASTIIIAAAIAGALVVRAWTNPTRPPTIERAANEYLRLAAALGERDPDALDQVIVESRSTLSRVPLEDIARDATVLGQQLEHEATTETTVERRRHHLVAQLGAIAARAEYLSGRRMPFEEEIRRQFGIDVPVTPVAPPADAVDALGRLLPGSGQLAARLDAYESQFVVASDRLPSVFEQALAECRARTRAHLSLPDGESVDVAFVHDRPWSGYSWYLGGNRSRIEVNVSFPLTVDRVLELACHEGYPGHHVQRTLRDSLLVRNRSWTEFSVLPIFSPESFQAEAAASIAASMTFTDDERLLFEQSVLFPLAGLDPGRTPEYLRIACLRDQVGDALASITGRYLAGDLDFVETSWALERDAIMAQPIATVQFINEYRGYALAYTLGRARMAPLIGPAVPPAERWANLRALIQGEL